MTIIDSWDVTVHGQGGRYRQKAPLTHWYPPTQNYTTSHPKRPQPCYSLPRNSEILCLMCIMLKKGTSFISHLFCLTSHFGETHATLRSWVKRVLTIVVPSCLPGLLEPFKMKTVRSLNTSGNTHPQCHSPAHANPQQFCQKNLSLASR